MKTRLALLIFCVSIRTSFSQNIDWAITGGSPGHDNIHRPIIDDNGNIYTLIELYPAGQVPVLSIQKNDPGGNLIWSVPLCSSLTFWQLVKTYSNNILLLANASDTTSLDGTTVLPGNFTARLDFNGTWGSVHSANLPGGGITGLDWFEYNDFSLDTFGELFIAGSHCIAFQGPIGNHSMKTWRMAQCIKLDSSFTSSTTISAGPDKTTGFRAIAEKNGNIINTINFNSSPQTFKLLKLDAMFDTLWISQPLHSSYSQASDVVEDDNQNIFITGCFEDTLIYDAIVLTGSPGVINRFVIMLDPAGQALWGKVVSTSLGSFGEFRFGGCANNHLFLTFLFKDTLQIGNYVQLTPDTNNIVLCLDMNGNPVWEWHHVFSLNTTPTISAVADENENVYMFGDFLNTFWYNSAVSNGGNDWFLMKMPNTNVGTDDIATLSSEVSEYPNPTQGIFYLNGKIKEAEIFDCSGRKILMQENDRMVDITGFCNGIYFCRLLSVDGLQHVVKLVKD